jgi:hypothetical protein
MAHFRNVSFQGRRLVCRLRMQHAPTPPRRPSTISDGSTVSTSSSLTSPPTPPPDRPSQPVIVGGSSRPASAIRSAEKKTIEQTSLTVHRGPIIPERFFIIKSLTIQDLIASVNNGTWEAQTHNEDNLQHAFDTSHAVYLFFSANKSGEYFGLARMTSGIVVAGGAQPQHNAQHKSHDSSDPKSTSTSASEFAVSGKIYDDSTRGTVFWEAERGDADESDTSDNDAVQNQKRQFSIEWISTSRVPFYRTRGLRNPWNGMKEVKIARDGTEIEPHVGRHLMHLFLPT